MKNKSLFICRLIYMVLFILSLVFISFRGGNLSYMLFSMMVINTVFSIVYILYVFYTIKIYQTIPERRITKNDTVSYNLKVNNESIIAYRAVQLNFMEQLSTINAAADFGCVGLEPGQKINVDTELCCKYSGTYFIGVDTIEIMDYFRIFRIRFQMPQKMKVTVKPRILKLDNISFITEEEECRNSGQKGKSEYRVDNEVRKYTSGDNKRLIHWKNSAKRQELMVRNLTAEEVSEYVVIMDDRVDTRDMTDRIVLCDKLRETVTALVYYIYGSGYSVLSVLGCSFEKEIHSRRDFDEFYNRIIDYGFGRNKEFDKVLLTLNQCTKEDVPFIIISSNPENISQEIMNEAEGIRNLHIIDVSKFDDIEEFLKVEK